MGSKKGRLRENLEGIAVALLLALFIRAFFIQAYKIPSSSMEPTLLVGDHLLVLKCAYGIRIPLVGRYLLEFSRPKRGDIIVFVYPRNPKKDFIKRVMGLPGERIQVIDRKVYVNGKPIEDPWGFWAKGAVLRPNFGPVIVPEGHYFVLGDNRDNSMDSRYWGFVPKENILGKALIIYWSWNSRGEGLLEKVRWARIGKILW
ncbi:MAG: signal peptidase I [Deltaproteobacteria bacterium]|nr:MAG: signal peptidase I [Deltaproteobacteria bacterium]